MPHELPKAYDPTAIEDRWAEYWVKENLFAQPTPSQDESQDGKSFTVLLPPPNVTGRLHMGHMLNQTEIDILVRWQRMSGRRALWVPGTDHAGIATQMMVERQVESEGSSRKQLGREAFEKRVWQWKQLYGGAILGQMKRLGVSVDWSREYFTMDDHLSVAVREAFVQLYEQGLIYRGAYIVNWCPRCQTAISDLEVVYDEHKGHLWEIRYPVIGDDGKDTGEFLTVATTRPETMLGDTAVAIHPEDERYTHLHGKKLRLPLVNREIPIILDEWVSREFGTGAVKVTPAHDPNDFALGQRHNLPSINVMDETAHINTEGGVYAGLDRYVARKKIVEDLEAQGLLAGIKDHVHNVGHCDRCKTVVEPRLSTQWFIAVNKKAKDGGDSMADLATAAVRERHTQIVPDQYEKIYLNWMTNIYDWCISRQLWWGHRIPAWHCATCHRITVARVDPTACEHCGSDKITQETDVLDTWFSSGLLPVSIFGWPNITAGNRADFDTFYPTSLLVTGFDILFFWVARMMMLGCWFASRVSEPAAKDAALARFENAPGAERPLGKAVPFQKVYIHALVRDANREKMSKTKGNVIDPIEIVKQYGTDAVRFTLASMASPGTDIAFNVARTEGYRAFANKIWNAARFIFMNVEKAKEAGIALDPSLPPPSGHQRPLGTMWIISRLNRTADAVNRSLEAYRFDEAANLIYQFIWGDFCDWYLEMVKAFLDFSDPSNTNGASVTVQTLRWLFEQSLRLLSPFMPFLTEELWHAFFNGTPPLKSIAFAPYPKGELGFDDAIETEMTLLQGLIVAVRSARKDLGVEEKAHVPVQIRATESVRSSFAKNAEIVQRLARVSLLEFVENFGDHSRVRSTSEFDIQVIYEKKIDVTAERERLLKEIARLEKLVANDERKLNDPVFPTKAPAHIVEGARKQLAENTLLLEKARAALAALPPE